MENDHMEESETTDSCQNLKLGIKFEHRNRKVPMYCVSM